MEQTEYIQLKVAKVAYFYFSDMSIIYKLLLKFLLSCLTFQCQTNTPGSYTSLNSHQSLHTAESYCSLLSHSMAPDKGLKSYQSFQSS